jgi:PAS domain-containing protein
MVNIKAPQTTNDSAAPRSLAVSDTALQVLASVGIEQYLDHNGQPTLYIDLDSDSFSEDEPWEAVLSASSRRWKLQKKSSFLAQPRLNIQHRTHPQDSPCHERLNMSTAGLSRQPLDSDHWAGRLLPESEHVKLFKNTDWQSTSLGSLRSWSRSLRVATQIVLSDPQAAALYWGPDRVGIYNEPFVSLIGRNHPALLGRPFQELWPEIWDDFDVRFNDIDRTGRATISTDSVLFLERHNYLEECWFTFSLIPVYDDSGNIGGIMISAQEVTRQALLDRRTKIINSLAIPPNFYFESIWQHILSVLASNESDITMAVLYTLDEGVGVGSGQNILKLQGTLGVPAGHIVAPRQADLETSVDGFFPALRKAKISGIPVVLRQQDGTLPDKLLDGFEWRGFGEPSTDIAAVPLLASEDYLLGFLIIGLNPRRTFDKDHQQFVQEFARQLTAVLASAVSVDQAQKRGARLLKELAESERRIRKMAEVSPIGMIDITSDGMLAWANAKYYDITGHSTDRKGTVADTDEPLSDMKLIS